MAEMVLHAKTLPEPLFSMIGAEKVKVDKSNGVISLAPILEMREDDCPLLGIAADCGFTVDEFLARKREEKRLEK